MDLQLVDGRQWVQSHPERFFRDGTPTDYELLCHGLRDPLYLDVPCTVARVEGWWVLASPQDWMQHAEFAVVEQFARVVAAPEQGVNSMRGAVVIGVFASAVVTYDGAGWLEVKGAAPASLCKHIEWTHHGGRVVAFRL